MMKNLNSVRNRNFNAHAILQQSPIVEEAVAGSRQTWPIYGIKWRVLSIKCIMKFDLGSRSLFSRSVFQAYMCKQQQHLSNFSHSACLAVPRGAWEVCQQLALSQTRFISFSTNAVCFCYPSLPSCMPIISHFSIINFTASWLDLWRGVPVICRRYAKCNRYFSERLSVEGIFAENSIAFRTIGNVRSDTPGVEMNAVCGWNSTITNVLYD